MTTRITRIGNGDNRKTTLRVEGSLRREEAQVLETTYQNLPAEQLENVEIDLSGISFMDSESASVLRRLQDLGVELVGLHFFTQSLIDLAERSVE